MLEVGAVLRESGEQDVLLLAQWVEEELAELGVN